MNLCAASPACFFGQHIFTSSAVIFLHQLKFIRRFAMHILPKGFVRIRHYGILSSTSKETCTLIIKAQLPAIKDRVKPVQELYNPKQCPCCKKETMHTILQFNRRGPPADWEEMAKNILECIA